jgi:hypothetical protein
MLGICRSKPILTLSALRTMENAAMDVFGPFIINGRAVVTDLMIAAGDKVSVLSTGLLEATVPGAGAANVVGVNGLQVLAPAGWLAPGLPQLGLVAQIDGQTFQLGKRAMLSAPPFGSMRLDVNAPPGTKFAAGWAVYVIRATQVEALPTFPDWRTFEDIAPVKMPPIADPSLWVATVTLGQTVHVFWTDEHSLKHCSIDLAGTVSPVEVVLAPPQHQIMYEISATIHGGQIHVLAVSGTTLVRVRGTTGAWIRDDVDGRANVSVGAVEGFHGVFNSVVSDGSEVHALYYSDKDAFGKPTLDLRHGRFTAVTITTSQGKVTTETWVLQTVDGAGGAGRIQGDAGQSVQALTDQGGQVHAFYYMGQIDAAIKAGRDLRHAVLEPAPAGGWQWRCETIDGAGKTFANAVGQVRRRVGAGIGCAMHDHDLHVFYNDLDFSNLRWAHRSPGGAWKMETIDGDGGPERRYGRTTKRLLPGGKAVISNGNQLDVFYVDNAADIRHAWLIPGLPWLYEIVDGDLDFDGRRSSDIQFPMAATRRGNELHLFYLTAETLRHAVMT